MTLIIRILTEDEKHEKINAIFNIQDGNYENYWEIKIPNYCIKTAYNLLHDKFHLLEQIQITKENISLWLLYEYEGQCNMEFNSNQLNLLAKLGINFCISCWEK